MPKIRRDTEPTASAPKPPKNAVEPFRVENIGAAEYGEEMPTLGVGGQPQAPYPTVDPAPCHYLVFAPDRWGVVEGRVVPILYRLPLSHGVNGVDGGPGQQPRLGSAREQIEAKGHTILPWDIDGRSYLRSYTIGEQLDAKTRERIKLKSWHTRWETLYPGSNIIQTDTAGYADWLVGLIESGKLPNPRPHVLGRMESEYSQFVANSSKKWGPDSDKALAYKRDLASIRAVIEKVYRPATAVPVEPEGDDPNGELGAE